MDPEQTYPFVTSGLKATRIKLVRDREDIDSNTDYFTPDMCHQVFGENETIFGYINLSINILYNASTFECYVNSSWDVKIDEEKTNLQAEDFMSKLNPWLPANFYVEKLDFVKCLSAKNNLKPFGIKIHSFILEDGPKKGCEFEIYTCNNKEPGYADFHQRLETLIVWYIDAANFIDIDDEKWRFYILYEKVVKQNSTCHYPVGYSTVYEYFAYPDGRRYRISQFIIFPPFQRLGLGTQLLKTVYDDLLKQSNIHDITVEDPSEGFQNMRDFVDAKFCSNLPSFAPRLLKGDFSKDMIMDARSKFGINEKQCRRVYEILRLLHIDPKDTNSFNQYRLLIKNRLNTPYKKQQNKKFVKLLKENPSLQNDDHHMKILEKSFVNLMKQYYRVIHRLKEDKSEIMTF